MEDRDGTSRFFGSMQSRDFAAIVAELIDTGRVDPQVCVELEEMLRKDDAAVQKYLEMVDLDARLRWAFRGGVGMSPAPNGKAGIVAGAPGHSDQRGFNGTMAAAILGESSAKADRPHLRASQRSTESRTHLRGLASLVVAASLLGVLVVYSAMSGWLASRSVGTITQTASAVWGQAETGLESGAGIAAGGYRLESGVVEITLRGNTRLIVEGPAAFELNTASHLSVRIGTISVFVSPSVVDFTADTPDARVVDLGTAFQLRVAEAGTEVHVLEGKVVASTLHAIDGAKQVNEIYLAERDAVRFNRADESVRAIDFVGEQMSIHGDVPLNAMPMAVTGDIRCLDHPPKSVAVDDFEHNDEMYLMLEQSDLVVDQEIYADRNSKGEDASKHGNSNMQIPAGSRVTSYLLHYDPTTRSGNDPFHRVSGTITFRSPIECVFLNPIGLFESDQRFGTKGTVYYRGERLAANRAVEDSDMVSFSPDGRTLILSLQANSSADQIRIIMMNERK